MYRLAIVDSFRYHGSVVFGLEITGPAERFPLFVGCSLRDAERTIHDLPARWIQSPGLALWTVKEFGTSFRSGSMYDGWHGQVIFALYSDDSFTSRLADTGWVNWSAPWLIGASVAGLEMQDEALEAKYGKRRQVWSKQKSPDPQKLPFEIAPPRFPGRVDLPISGPRDFVRAVTAVLDELETKAPHRYREAVEYLPEARWDDTIEARALSGGAFRINVHDPHFINTFLHEVGHSVAGHGITRHDLSKEQKESEAFAYEDVVITELGRPLRRH